MDSVAKMSQLHKSHSCQNVTVVKKSLCHKSHCCKNVTGQKIGQIRPPTVGNGPVGNRPHRGNWPPVEINWAEGEKSS